MAIAIARRQGPFQRVAATSQPFAVTATVANQALIAIFTLKTGATQQISSVSSASGTWQLIGTPGSVTGSNTRISCWVCEDATASITTITAVPSTSLAVSMELYELTGVDTVASIQSASGGDAVSDTAWNTGPLTPTAGTYLLISAISTNATVARTVSAVSTGWSTAVYANGSTTLQSIGISDRIVTADGSTAYSNTFTASAAQTNGWYLFAVPEAAAGGASHPLTGVVVATSVASSTRISEEQPFTGALVATSTATASVLQEQQPLAGALIATSLASATRIIEQQPLSGGLVASSAASATRITEEQPLAGSLVATSVVSGAFASDHPLTGSVVATSVAAASRLSTQMPLAGSVSASSVAAATRIIESHPLTASAVATSVAAATQITETQPLTGAVVATSTASATRIVESQPLAGSLAATSNAAATRLVAQQPLTGAIVASSAIAGELAAQQGTHPLTGTVTATSVAAATRIAFAQPLTAGVVSTSTMTATRLVLTNPLVGNIFASSAAGATRISEQHPLAGGSVASSIAQALMLREQHPLTGALYSTSDMLGVLSGILVANRTFVASARIASPFAAGRTQRTYVATIDAGTVTTPAAPVRSFNASRLRE